MVNDGWTLGFVANYEVNYGFMLKTELFTMGLIWDWCFSLGLWGELYGLILLGSAVVHYGFKKIIDVLGAFEGANYGELWITMDLTNWVYGEIWV